MSFHVPHEERLGPEQHAQLGSSPLDGNNGIFMLKRRRLVFVCQASDGLGWEHVSVSIKSYSHNQLMEANRTPTWEEMCWIKDKFWDTTDTVVQYHPAAGVYVNCHPHCLHLWRPANGHMPIPNPWLIGPQE